MTHQNSFFGYPDSLAGAIIAFEEIEGGVSIINAPTGCKFVPGSIVDSQDIRTDGVNPFEYQDEFYFGQPRVPCTYLDEIDYVHGSHEKLKRLLVILEKKGHQIIGIVNGPGTALIGDNLRGIADEVGINVPVFLVEESSFDGTTPQGYAKSMVQVFDYAIKNISNTSENQNSLAITGINLLNFRWKDNIDQLRSELAIAGIEDVVFAGAGASLEDINRATSAQYICPANEVYGRSVAKALTARNTACEYIDGLLDPVGLQASEKWLTEIALRTSGNIEALRARFKDIRKTLYTHISRFTSRMGFPEGLTCYISADESLVAPLMLYVFDYLGIYPSAIYIHQRAEASGRFIKQFIKERQLKTKIEYQLIPLEEAELIRKVRPDIVFGSSHTLVIASEALGYTVPFVPVAYPNQGTVYLVPRPVMGLGGTLVLTENILNAIVRLSRTAIF
jgi:nitrogenase molybdenum-iron protein alpha/beta subunit